MKKLDDIPKKNPFDVPDGYFDQLPGRIQARVQGQSRETRPAWVPGVRYAMAAMLIVAAVAFVWLWRSPAASDGGSPADVLATLETADLIAYLNEGDLTTDELLDGVYFNNEDALELEETVFNLGLNDADLNELVTEID